MADYIQNAIKNLEKQREKIEERIEYFTEKETDARQNKELKIQEREFINDQIKKLESNQKAVDQLKVVKEANDEEFSGMTSAQMSNQGKPWDGVLREDR